MDKWKSNIVNKNVYYNNDNPEIILDYFYKFVSI